MPTQSVSIAVLRGGVGCRRFLDYAAGHVFGTVMRHVLPPVAVVLRAGRVVEPAGAASLVASPRLALLAPPCRRRAGARGPGRSGDTGRTPARTRGGGRRRSAASPRLWPRPPRTGRRPRAVRSSTPALGVRPEGSRVQPRAFALSAYGTVVLSRSAGSGQFPAIRCRSRFTRFYATTDMLAPAGACAPLSEANTYDAHSSRKL